MCCNYCFFLDQLVHNNITSNSGGGGERVLWIGVHAILLSEELKKRKVHVLIYTGDVGVDKNKMLNNVQVRSTQSSVPLVHFVYSSMFSMISV